MSKQAAPAWWVLASIYCTLGWVFVHFYGRPFASVAHEDLAHEFAVPLLAIASFVLSYEIFDCMGVGIVAIANAHKFKDGKISERFQTPVVDLPSDYVRALRAQSNQIEQMPFFMAMLLGAVLFVDGVAVGMLGVVYCFTRALYGRAYRAGGLTSALSAYTMPCYFMMGTVAGINVVGAIQLLWQ